MLFVDLHTHHLVCTHHLASSQLNGYHLPTCNSNQAPTHPPNMNRASPTLAPPPLGLHLCPCSEPLGSTSLHVYFLANHRYEVGPCLTTMLSVRMCVCVGTERGKIILNFEAPFHRHPQPQPQANAARERARHNNKTWSCGDAKTNGCCRRPGRGSPTTGNVAGPSRSSGAGCAVSMRSTRQV